MLEIAEGTYSQKFSCEEIKQKILHYTSDNENATIIGDLTKTETLPKNRVDCFICTQTFNFIYGFKDAMLGARYLLKDNGVLLATVAGLSQISRYDMGRWGDYFRFTDLSLAKIAEEAGFKSVEVVTLW